MTRLPPSAAEHHAQAQVQARLAALSMQVGTMQAVNEQLVIAGLTQQAQAERAEQALNELITRSGLDPLTQLPTRSMFAGRLEQAMAHARRHGSHCAVLFFDVDQFKHFNDRHGHAFGDAVLCLVAARLTAALREVDSASRHGGDEFLVLLAELAQAGDAQGVAAKLAAAMAEPAVIDGCAVTIAASVGVALFPQDGSTVDALVAAADAAMYAAKQQRSQATSQAQAQSQSQLQAQSRPSPAAMHGPSAAEVQALLRAANERLVLSALAAQSCQRQADAARRRQLVRMSALLVRLLAASNLQEGTAAVAPDWTTLDLRAVVALAVAELQPVAQCRGQVLQWQSPLQALPVLGDALHLQQVLAQMLENACRHSPDGASIVVEAEDSGERVMLSVRDPGPGPGPGLRFTAEAPNPVAAPVDPWPLAPGMQGVGPGVGLSLAHALAQVHGGSVEALSRGQGQGGELLLTLPLTGPRSAA